MNANIKAVMLALAGMVMVQFSFSQQAVPQEVITDPGNIDTGRNILPYARNKQLPAGYEKEVLEALAHFPELKNVPITFRFKKSLSTLKTRPRFISVFMPRGHRSYIITISNKTVEKLMPVLFTHLPYNARVGIAGHELSHVADLSGKTTWQCFKVGIRHLSARYLDRFEYNTDLICIQHGLGENLEAWSSFIRKTMHTVFWRGAGYVNKGDSSFERYMNPATIKKYMSDMRTFNKK